MRLKALFGCLLGAFLIAPACASAQTNYPIRVIIPYAPGGGTDILFRIIAPAAEAILGQSIIVDNRPGGSTIIGTGAVARASADGSTLLATDSAIFVNPGLFKSRLPYDTLKELRGVTMMATSPALLVVHPSLPAKNLSELIALAKSKPGILNYGSGGIGTSPHLAGELLKLAAGIDVQHVPYKGTGPTLTAVLAGQVEMAFVGISSARSYIESHQLRAIAITGQGRQPAIPEVPTFLESNLDVNANSYWGIYAPSAVPASIVEKLNRAFTQSLHTPENEKKLAELGFTPVANTPEQHTTQLHTMVNQWTSVIDRAGIKVE